MTLATAVILSYDRQDVLRRQLLYYANKPVHLIFADGSDIDWGTGDSGSIGEMTWEYFRVAGFDSYLTRLQIAVNKVETEFMFLIDDEECILWTGVEKAIKFLKQNPDHSCAGGRIDAVADFRKQFLVDVNVRWGRPFSLINDDALQRVLNLVEANWTASIYYQVQRSKVLKALITKTKHLELKNKYAGTLEIVIGIFLIFHGKWTRGEYPFHLRFGGSIPRPSTEPNFLSESSIVEIIDETKSLTLEIFATSPESMPSDLIWQNLNLAMTESYGEFARERRGLKRSIDAISIKQKMTRSNKFKKFLRSSVLFFWPHVFEKMYPGELMRVKTYTSRYSEGSVEVATDLARFGYIWSQFKYGLSKEQFERELVRYDSPVTFDEIEFSSQLTVVMPNE